MKTDFLLSLLLYFRFLLVSEVRNVPWRSRAGLSVLLFVLVPKLEKLLCVLKYYTMSSETYFYTLRDRIFKEIDYFSCQWIACVLIYNADSVLIIIYAVKQIVLKCMFRMHMIYARVLS